MAKCNNCFHNQVCDFACKRCDGANCIFFVDSSRMVELPCKVGDTVYRIDKSGCYPKYEPFVQELTVTEISWKHEKYGNKDLGFAIIANGIRYKFSSIGKTVFLNREEAEAELARRTANG